MSSYTGAALRGFGSYTGAALRGMGVNGANLIGKKTAKGSAAAKAKMAYLRSLRKKKGGAVMARGTIGKGIIDKGKKIKLLSQLMKRPTVAKKPELSPVLERLRNLNRSNPMVSVMGKI